MTEVSRRHIGFDRKIELDWLDATASQALAGASPKDAREAVWRLLDGVVAGSTTHNARGKTLTVLSKIWISVPEQARELRDIALVLMRETFGRGRLPIHWAMMMAVYPFFLDVAANAGKLIAMNGDVTVSQIVRRMLDAWGDRSTLPRATQRILRSMVQWGVLKDGKLPGQYLPASRKINLLDDSAEILLLGMLIGLGHGMSLRQGLVYPALFPFQLTTSETQLRGNAKLLFHRQADQSDFVEIRV